MKVLVTGAGGFIGRELVGYLVGKGYYVVPTYHADVFSYSDAGAHLELCDATHLDQLSKALPDVSTVIHLAGRIEISLEPNPIDKFKYPIPGDEQLSEIYRINVLATANVLSYCLKNSVGHLVFASSQAVYGLPSVPEITEETEIHPLEHYAASKVACETMLRVGSRRGLAVTILRFPGVYGEKRRSGTVYQFCRAALSRGRIEVTVPYPLPFDVLHIDDVISGFEACIRFGGDGYKCFNLSSDEECSLDVLADSIAALVPNCSVQHAPVAQPRIRISSAKARKVLGWQSAPRKVRLQAMLEALRNGTRAPNYRI